MAKTEDTRRFRPNQIDRLLNRNEKKPKEAKELDQAEKGIQLFFGEKERKFLENVGREITIEILQESFIIYRIDYRRTQTHDLYGESKKKIWLPPVEVFGRINVEAQGPEYMTPGGIIRKGFGEIEVHTYLSHLEDLSITIKMGDFMYHKGNFYEITDDGSSNIGNEFAFGGDKQFYITIKGIEVNSDVFKAR